MEQFKLIFAVFENWSKKLKLLTMTQHIFLRIKPLIQASQGRFTMTGGNLEERKKSGIFLKKVWSFEAIRLERRRCRWVYFT